MDTTRRGFFGTLAALMVAPKLTLAGPSTDVVECEAMDVPVMGSRLMYAVKIEDYPLRLSRVYGPITRVSKPKPGVYTIEWTPPKDFNFFMANVCVNGEYPSPNIFAFVRDPTDKSLSVETCDVETYAQKSVEELSIIITLVGQ